MSAGITTLMPALPRRLIVFSWMLSVSMSPLAGPIDRDTQVARYTTEGAPAAAGAGCWSLAAPLGTYLFQWTPNSTPKGAAMAPKTALPSTPWILSTVLRSTGTVPIMAPNEETEAWAALKGRVLSSYFLARTFLTRRPVLMLTGHFVAHMPSAAHVSSALYWYRSFIRTSLAASSGITLRSRRAISRVVTMRCLGVRVTWPEGQALSQKPHSMQLSTTPCATGRGLRFSLWTLGLVLRTTPGLS
mmetsp:Transcript_17832/g.41186  ORF Transcript_17832/g.41186 Transcript_17832/m.41186 type:complete len:245 (-) Transcript_17832:1905-2639(-)